MEVFRRFSDFLGLRDKLAEKHLHFGVIIPPPPEKSLIGTSELGYILRDQLNLVVYLMPVEFLDNFVLGATSSGCGWII